MMLQSSSANTILQTLVDEDLRGRVMAFFSVAVLGTQPLGSLVAGAVAERIGAPRTILFGAIGCVLTGAWFAFRRPILAVHAPDLHRARHPAAARGDADADRVRHHCFRSRCPTS